MRRAGSTLEVRTPRPCLSAKGLILVGLLACGDGTGPCRDYAVIATPNPPSATEAQKRDEAIKRHEAKGYDCVVSTRLPMRATWVVLVDDQSRIPDAYVLCSLCN